MNILDEPRNFKKYRWIKNPWYKPDELEDYTIQSTIRAELEHGTWIDPYLIVEVLCRLTAEIEDLKNKLDK